jgi:hypothetical protein
VIVQGKIDGWDWAHNTRTNIYLTREGNIAILGPQSDYAGFVADSKTRKLNPLWIGNESSETWRYTGAFDFGTPSLRFFPGVRSKGMHPNAYGISARFILTPQSIPTAIMLRNEQRVTDR